MDVLREVDADLEILNQNLISGRTWDLFSSLQVKYSETLVWIREKHVVDGSKLQRDDLGQALLPDDIPLSRQTSRLVAYKSTANGNCMFNSCSRLLVGDDSLSSCLRLLTALELATNGEYYAAHPKLEEASRSSATYSASTLFSICLSILGPSNWNKPEDHVMAIEGEDQGKLTDESPLTHAKKTENKTTTKTWACDKMKSHENSKMITMNCSNNRP